ncbi:GNAT family N-acetyltransferase [Novosphingobium album (ex Liu et al. 2023)]|uniref:GNAT family N-acetyltransferase n=1 Tax=Novosphingobium album (ex Liu et al. 2023) TaxID=3031130 RepID=A0ABT5WUL0_9SPHN|nr:GNAT family N-acetyltransferase [Novosphingobium album (ex Liu et al. 2023)]MDE8653543.1 GNAT family N-acetyltransferase [Novosphingobium album (ex Liu et al. 2023)]
MVKVEYHADLKEVQSDAGLAALLSSDAQAAPFDRLAWWQGLAEHCGLAPMIAVARDGADYAVLPLTGADGHLGALSNWYSFRFRPVASPGADAGALLAGIAADLGTRAHRVTLSGLPDEDGTATLVETAFRKAGWLVAREVCDANHMLDVAGRDYATYLAARPGKLRTTLKRKAGKVATEVLTRFDADAWDAYEAIYRESWKPEEGSPDFLRAFAQAEGAAGRLRLGVAHAKDEETGEAIAAQMWTVEGGTAFIHKLAHRESARPLSPGSVLSAALFRHVIDGDKVSLVDFGTGDDPYKRDWMEAVRPRYRLDMFRPLSPRNWLIFAKIGLRRLAATAKRG